MRQQKRKKSEKRLKEIDDQLTNLEASYRAEQKSEFLNKITALKYEYNSVMSKNVSKLLVQVRQRYFEFGDRPHRLLARELRQTQASRAIHCIKSKDGTLLTDPEKINNCFAYFYANVYQSQGEPDCEAMEEFFENLTLPKLSTVSTSLLALLHSLSAVKRSLFSNSFVVGNTLKIWKQIKSYIKAPKIYVDTPVCENHSFTPGLTDGVFSTWKQSGICTIGDLYVNGNFASFAQF